MTQDEKSTDDKLNHWASQQRKTQLAIANVPEKFRHLMPVAQEWGTIDGPIRYELLKRSSNDILQALIDTVKPYHSTLDEWLAGPEAHSTLMSKEYLAFTNMRLAVDEARLILRRRKGSNS